MDIWAPRNLTPRSPTDAERAAVATLQRMMVEVGAYSLSLSPDGGPRHLRLQGEWRVGPVLRIGDGYGDRPVAWTEAAVDGVVWVGGSPATAADMEALGDAAGAYSPDRPRHVLIVPEAP